MFSLSADEDAQFARNCENADHRALVFALHARRFTAVARHLAKATPAQIEDLIPLNPNDAPEGGVPPHPNELRTSAVWIACYHPDLLPLIVSIGADVNQRYNHDYAYTYTLLGGAVREGLADVVCWLIDAGADLDPTDPGVHFFYTPLFIAVEQNLRPMVELLLLRGASPNHKSGEGPLHSIPGYPLEAALDSEDPHILELLLACGADAHTCCTYAVARLPLEKMEWFLSNTSYDLRRQADEDDGVLHHVIARGTGGAEDALAMKAKVRFLVGRGAPLESAGRYAAFAAHLLE